MCNSTCLQKAPSHVEEHGWMVLHVQEDEEDGGLHRRHHHLPSSCPWMKSLPGACWRGRIRDRRGGRRSMRSAMFPSAAVQSNVSFSATTGRQKRTEKHCKRALSCHRSKRGEDILDGGGPLAYPIPGDETVVLLVVEAQAAAKASAPPVQPLGRLPSEQPLGKGRILLGGACLCLSIKIQHLYSTLIVTAALHHRCHPQSGGQLEAVLRTKPSCQPFVRCRNLPPYARRRMRRSVQHRYHLCVC